MDTCVLPEDTAALVGSRGPYCPSSYGAPRGVRLDTLARALGTGQQRRRATLGTLARAHARALQNSTKEHAWTQEKHPLQLRLSCF